MVTLEFNRMDVETIRQLPKNYSSIGSFKAFSMHSLQIQIKSFSDRLFIPERLNRVEPRSFPSGIVTKGDSDRHRDNDGCDDGGHR